MAAAELSGSDWRCGGEQVSASPATIMSCDAGWRSFGKPLSQKPTGSGLVRKFTDHGQQIRTSAACGSAQSRIVAQLGSRH